MKTVESMINGSKAIDLMRTEIKQVVSMLLSLLSSQRAPNPMPPVSFQLARSFWTIGIMPKDPGRHLKIRYQTADTNLWFEWDYQSKDCPIRMSCVREVYCGLEVLVQGVLSTFPEIEKDEEWRALMSASELNLLSA